jgi:hypothetical protein
MLRAVFAFSENDVWAGTSGPYHWDGVQWRTFNLNGSFNGYVNKIWGTSSRDIYIVGTNGSIAHYNGVSFQKIESGTTLDIQDIWGAKNPVTGETEILAVASNKYLNQGHKLLRIQGTSVTMLPDSGLSWSLSGIWFTPPRHYLIVGDGLFFNGSPFVNSSWVADVNHITTFYTDAIRGTGINDVVIVGVYGEVLHFNGYSWRSFKGVTELGNGQYNAVSIKENLVVTVGDLTPRAIAAIGKR